MQASRCEPFYSENMYKFWSEVLIDDIVKYKVRSRGVWVNRLLLTTFRKVHTLFTEIIK
jgi:hypothetical protein